MSRYVHLAYNLQDLVTNVSNGNGTVLTLAYDIYDRPSSVTDARGVTISYAYANGNFLFFKE